MDADADRIWPQVRRRPSRQGATGVHVGRTTTNVTRPTRIASKSATSAGLRSSRMRPRDPLSTAPQKKSVAPVPKSPPVGTA